MLTKFIVAGLIPGMMAKPILPRQGANERREVENRDYYVMKPMPIAHTAISPLPSLGPSAIPSVSTSFPTFPISKQSTATPIIPISSFPVAPPPKLQSVVPAVEYAVAAPPAYPTAIPSIAVPSAVVEIKQDIETTSVVPVVTPTSAPSYPVKNEYIVKSPPVISQPSSSAPPISKIPTFTPPVSKTPLPVVHVSHTLPSVAPSVPAQHQYAVAEVPKVESPVVPSAAPSFPTYSVHELPVYAPAPVPAKSDVVPSIVPSAPAYSVHDLPVLASAAVTPAPSPVIASAAPSFPAYSVHELPVFAPAAIPAESHAAPSIAPSAPSFAPSAPSFVPSAPSFVPSAPSVASSAPSVALLAPSVAPSAPAYRVQEPPVHVSSAAAVAAAAKEPAIPAPSVEPVDAVETPVVAVPVVTPDPAGPSGKNECVTKCHPECKKGDSQCMAACLQTCHSAKMLGSNGFAGKLLNNNAVANDDDVPTANAKVAGKPTKDAPTLAAGAGFKSYDACMASCKKKFQTADIAFPISQGKSDCAEACAGYASDGAGVTAAKREIEAKRAVEPVLGALRPAAPALTTEAGYASYEACMEDCHGKWQSANIVFDISQGKGGCKKACAQYAKDGSGVTVERAVEPVSGALRPTGPEFTTGAGYTSYEACMEACNGRWQNANIVFDIGQGRKNCKAACASGESDGSSTVVKKETTARSHSGDEVGAKKTTRAFPFEGNGPLNKDPTPKDGPFTKAPETSVGASTGNYEACMHGCGTKLQTADVAFEVEQGNSECATRCAQYSTNGAGMSHA